MKRLVLAALFTLVFSLPTATATAQIDPYGIGDGSGLGKLDFSPEVMAGVMIMVKAMAKGDPEAQYRLGVMYETDTPLRDSSVKALMWYSLSADTDKVTAYRSIAEKARAALAEKMTPAQIAEAQRLAKAWLAARSR